MKIGIVAGVLIVALSMAYYLVIYVPRRDQLKIEKDKLEQQSLQHEIETRKIQLDECLESNRKNQLASNISIGEMLHARGADSEIDQVIRENNKRIEIERQECFKKFPI